MFLISMFFGNMECCTFLAGRFKANFIMHYTLEIIRVVIRLKMKKD